MRIAVIRAFGQLGSDLMPLLGDRGIALGHTDIEIAEHTALRRRSSRISRHT